MFGFQKRSEEIKDQLIFFHEDYSHDNVSEALVGRKAKSLFQLRSMDIPTPDFFAISPEVFRRFLLNAFDNKIETVMENVQSPDIEKLEELILEAEFSEEFHQELARAYSRLSGFSNAWVAVRSSVVYPADPSATFSGVFKTELNIRGIEDLIDSIKHIYLSVFRDSVIVYAKDRKVDLSNLQMGVVVQKMVQPEVSGIAYTVDPITGNNKHMSIEAVFGLGDVIADGAITPDQYLLSKKNLEILEKHVTPQDWMKVRSMAEKKEPGKTLDHQRIQISQSWSHQQKLEDKNIEYVAKIALIAEDRADKPQIVEWVWESGTPWVLQNKPIVKKEELEKKTEEAKKDKVEAEPSKKEKETQKDETVFDVAVDILKEEKLKEKSVIGSVVAEKKAEEGEDKNKKASEDVTESKTEVEKDKTTEDTKSKEEAQELSSKEEVADKGSVTETDDSEVSEAKSKSEEEKKEQYEKLDKEQIEKEYEKKEQEVKRLDTLSERFRKISQKTAKKISKKKDDVADKQFKKLSSLGIKSTKDSAEFLLTGIGASNGSVVGEVKVLDGSVPDELAVTKGTILLIKNFTQEMESYISEAAGVLMDEGGLTSDVSILCREAEVPAVVGTGLASALVDEGDVVKIDGNVGSVYRINKEEAEEKLEDEIKQKKTEDGKEDADKKVSNKDKADSLKGAEEAKKKEAEMPKPTKTATKVMLTPKPATKVDEYSEYKEFVDGYALVDMDKMMLSRERHPMDYVEKDKYKDYSKELELELDAYTDVADGDEVIVSIGSGSVDQFRDLVKGSSWENKDLPGSVNGVQHYMEHTRMLSNVLHTLRRARNVYKSRNLSLAIHSPMNGGMMKDMKKEISAAGLTRTTTFNIYAVIDKPSEVILVDDILASGLDGVIINTPWLARQMQGYSIYEEDVKYDLSVGSVYKSIEDILDSVKGTKNRVLIVAEDDTALIKKAVEWGVYGVMVSPDVYHDAKKVVADTEAKKIMGL